MCGQKSTVSAAVYILFVITPSGLSRSSDFPSLSPSRTPAPTLQGLGGVFGSLTQLRRAWVPPWTQPLPLGASVCCQARGCGLREVDVCTARSHPGCPFCPSSALNLPCQASRQGSVHEGRPESDWGLPLFRHWANKPGEKVGTGREEESVLCCLNYDFPQTCCVTSGRSLHISEPLLPCKQW